MAAGRAHSDKKERANGIEGGRHRVYNSAALQIKVAGKVIGETSADAIESLTGDASHGQSLDLPSDGRQCVCIILPRV